MIIEKKQLEIKETAYQWAVKKFEDLNFYVTVWMTLVNSLFT
jgi:hypothetical protein